MEVDPEAALGQNPHSSVQFDDGINLDGKAERNTVHADRRAGMDPTLSEDVDHQVRTTVDDLRNLDEVRPSLDKGTQLQDAADPIEIAVGRGLDLGDQVDPAQARGMACGLQINILTDNALDPARRVERIDRRYERSAPNA